ncbi:MAG: hypothetical protein D6788_07345 [Planctomycetota bacterium]|nr:MAG: hypothetical protein D6788_07345 [Planctomycetota bacterium]
MGEKARKDIARHIESEIEAARTAVARLLGLDPPRGVVVDTSLANLPEIATRLRRYPWRLTWPVANSRVGGDSVADRTAVGLIRNEGEGVQWPERSILRHEVAHALAKIGSSEGAETGSEGGYGTDLPDWLDELPAIFAEDEDLSNRRRVLWHSFCKRYGRLPFPLLRFFAMEHPLWSDQKFREAVRLQNGSKVAKVRGTRTIVLSRSRFQVLSQEAAMYYAQVRGVIDFLVDEDSLAVVALLMKKGSRGELKDPAVVSEIFRTRGVDLTEDRLLAYCVGIE